MSKELRAFKKICKNLNSYEFTDEYKKNKKLIEIALERLIELEDIFSEIKSGEAVVVSAEKSVALEVIKEKLFYIDFKLLLSSTDYETYCFMVGNKKLTKQEYDLLKEVLL